MIKETKNFLRPNVYFELMPVYYSFFCISHCYQSKTVTKIENSFLKTKIFSWNDVPRINPALFPGLLILLIYYTFNEKYHGN